MTLARLDRAVGGDATSATTVPPTVPEVTNGPTPPAGEARFVHFVVPEVEVMYRVARSITGTHADAEDLVQDSLVRAFRAIDRFDGRHPRAWLLTIVRNTQINRTRRRRPSLLDDPDRADVEARMEITESGEDTYLDATYDARVIEALGSLSANSRQVVELVDLADLSYAEAAEVLDVPIGTVMSRLHRARTKIRDHLDVQGFVRGERP